MQLKQTRFLIGSSLFIALSCILFVACNKQPIGPTEPDPTPPGAYMPFTQFRALYTNSGTDVFVPAGNKKIRGKVISNFNNEAPGNYRLQDESGAGIYLYAANGSPIYALGSVLEIDAASSGVLTLFNGDLELKGVPSSKVKTLDTALVTITPRVATVRQAIDSIQNWASSLVTINNVTITLTTSNTAGQNYNIVDATGTIVSFVRTTLGLTLPTGGATSITGYLSIYQPNNTGAVTPQLIIRNAADVVNGGQSTGGSGSTTGITLPATSPYTIDFNSIAIGLPTGVFVDTAATATFLGKPATGSFIASPSSSLWKAAGFGFKNYASATGITNGMGADSTTQVNATNRALGVRQTNTGGADPGAAFIFLLNNTTGKNNLKLDFQLQSLDTSSVVTRTTTWAVDYAIGDAPTSFINANATGTVFTGNKVFSNNAISVSFPTILNNVSQKVWIRIVALAPSTGSGSRASTGIDDVKFSWN